MLDKLRPWRSKFHDPVEPSADLSTDFKLPPFTHLRPRFHRDIPLSTHRNWFPSDQESTKHKPLGAHRTMVHTSQGVDLDHLGQFDTRLTTKSVDVYDLGFDVGLKRNGYLETMLISFTVGLFVSFGIKFLWDQTSRPSLGEYQSCTPCTDPFRSNTGNPSDCPDIQIGANGLVVGIIFNGVCGFIFLLTLYSRLKVSENG